MSIWRTVKSFPDYEIDILGTVRNKETGYAMGSFKEHGIMHTLLRTPDGPVAINLEMLVVEAFPFMAVGAKPAVEGFKDPELSYPVVSEIGFPYGFQCLECCRGIPEGKPYSEKTIGMLPDGSAITQLVCVYC